MRAVQRWGAPLTHAEIQPLLAQVDGWRVEGDKRLIKKFEFKDFMGPIGFANKIAEIAEEQGHSDLYVAWGKVKSQSDAQDRRAHGIRLHPRGEDR